MQKTNFVSQSFAMGSQARAIINEVIEEKKEVVLITDEQEEDGEIDIYGLPDFEFYDKYGFVEFANITSVNQDGVTGKGKDSGSIYTVMLSELSNSALFQLADHLTN